jgi:hypothetical protein
VLPLGPVDKLSVLTVCDNTVDMLLPNEGPAKRLSLAGMARQAPMLEAPTLRGGKAANAPLGQHGFSALVEIRKGSRVRRLLFDTGVTPPDASKICAAWKRIRQISRRSSAVTATSTTPPDCPASSASWAGRTCRC